MLSGPVSPACQATIVLRAGTVVQEEDTVNRIRYWASELPPLRRGLPAVPGDHGDPWTCLSQITGELPVARPQGIL